MNKESVHFHRQLHGNLRKYVESLKQDDWTKLKYVSGSGRSLIRFFQHLKHFSGYTLIIRKRSLKDKRYRVVLLNVVGRPIHDRPITVTPCCGLPGIDLDIIQLLDAAIEI